MLKTYCSFSVLFLFFLLFPGYVDWPVILSVGLAQSDSLAVKGRIVDSFLLLEWVV